MDGALFCFRIPAVYNEEDCDLYGFRVIVLSSLAIRIYPVSLADIIFRKGMVSIVSGVDPELYPCRIFECAGDRDIGLFHLSYLDLVLDSNGRGVIFILILTSDLGHALLVLSLHRTSGRYPVEKEDMGIPAC